MRYASGFSCTGAFWGVTLLTEAGDLSCKLRKVQHSIERTPEDRTRYARSVAACAAFLLVLWGGDGVGMGWGGGGGGVISPCRLFHLAPRAGAMFRSSYCSFNFSWQTSIQSHREWPVPKAQPLLVFPPLPEAAASKNYRSLGGVAPDHMDLQA